MVFRVGAEKSIEFWRPPDPYITPTNPIARKILFYPSLKVGKAGRFFDLFKNEGITGLPLIVLDSNTT